MMKPMNISLLKLHKTELIYLFLSIFFVCNVTFSLGEIKAIASIDWFDVLGEGSISLLLLIWIFFTSISRLAGRVTRLLLAGLIMMHISMLLDFLDEFLIYADDSWITTIESLPAPVGMLMMTIALYYWHQEQLIINQQLQKKERFYREHRYIDAITGLYSAAYMKEQITREIEHIKDSNNDVSLIMLDIKHFDQFNRKYGDVNGNNFLKDIAQLITLNVRSIDLVCRLASDKFIVLLPYEKADYAETISKQIQDSISSWAYKTNGHNDATFHTVLTTFTSVLSKDNCEGLLERLNTQLRAIKMSPLC